MPQDAVAKQLLDFPDRDIVAHQVTQVERGAVLVGQQARMVGDAMALPQARGDTAQHVEVFDFLQGDDVRQAEAAGKACRRVIDARLEPGGSQDRFAIAVVDVVVQALHVLAENVEGFCLRRRHDGKR